MKRTIDPENPPWTDADFRRARPSREVVPHIVAAYLKRRGRETEGDKESESGSDTEEKR